MSTMLLARQREEGTVEALCAQAWEAALEPAPKERFCLLAG